MKMMLRIPVCIFAVLLLIIALMFAVIEGRLLCSGDWLLHEMPTIAFLCYISRFALTVLAGSFACRILFAAKKK